MQPSLVHSCPSDKAENSSLQKKNLIIYVSLLFYDETNQGEERLSTSNQPDLAVSCHCVVLPLM